MQCSFRFWTFVFFIACGGGYGKTRDPGVTSLPPMQLEEAVSVRACGGAAGVVANPVVLADAECLEARVQVGHVSSPHTLRFLYYDPDGNLYLATRPDWSFQPQEGKTGYHRRATIRHTLLVRGEHAALLVGGWTVEARLDGTHLSEAKFQIDRKPLPTAPALEEARKHYLALQYEKAVDSMRALLETGPDPRLAAQAHWWSALAYNALGQEEQMQTSLVEALRAEPVYAVSSAEAKAASAEEVRSLLEGLRAKRHPDLYKKTAAAPELVELTPAEEPPVMGKRQRWYQKWWIYAIAGAVAIPVTAVLAGGGGDEVPPLLPTIAIAVARNADRDPSFGFLCEGQILVEVAITGRGTPFDVVYTVGLLRAAGNGTIDIAGVGILRANEERIVALENGIQQAETRTVRLPAIDVVNPLISPANIQFTAIVRDSLAPAFPTGVGVGQVVSDSLRALIDADDRVNASTAFDVMIDRCKQEAQ